MNLKKYKDLLGLLVSILTCSVMLYKMISFVNQIDYRIGTLEKSNASLEDQVNQIAEKQSLFLQETQSRINKYVITTNDRLTKLEHSK